jgi:hypothetical protein
LGAPAVDLDDGLPPDPSKQVGKEINIRLTLLKKVGDAIELGLAKAASGLGGLLGGGDAHAPTNGRTKELSERPSFRHQATEVAAVVSGGYAVRILFRAVGGSLAAEAIAAGGAKNAGSARLAQAAANGTSQQFEMVTRMAGFEKYLGGPKLTLQEAEAAAVKHGIDMRMSAGGAAEAAAPHIPAETKK